MINQQKKINPAEPVVSTPTIAPPPPRPPAAPVAAQPAQPAPSASAVPDMTKQLDMAMSLAQPKASPASPTGQVAQMSNALINPVAPPNNTVPQNTAVVNPNDPAQGKAGYLNTHTDNGVVATPMRDGDAARNWQTRRDTLNQQLSPFKGGLKTDEDIVNFYHAIGAGHMAPKKENGQWMVGGQPWGGESLLDNGSGYGFDQTRLDMIRNGDVDPSNFISAFGLDTAHNFLGGWAEADSTPETQNRAIDNPANMPEFPDSQTFDELNPTHPGSALVQDGELLDSSGSVDANNPSVQMAMMQDLAGKVPFDGGFPAGPGRNPGGEAPKDPSGGGLPPSQVPGAELDITGGPDGLEDYLTSGNRVIDDQFAKAGADRERRLKERFAARGMDFADSPYAMEEGDMLSQLGSEERQARFDLMDRSQDVKFQQRAQQLQEMGMNRDEAYRYAAMEQDNRLGSRGLDISEMQAKGQLGQQQLQFMMTLMNEMDPETLKKLGLDKVFADALLGGMKKPGDPKKPGETDTREQQRASINTQVADIDRRLARGGLSARDEAALKARRAELIRNRDRLGS